jgi:hypothetical protein
MDLPAPANKPSPLNQVREQFEHWRQTRKKLEPQEMGYILHIMLNYNKLNKLISKYI